jgi:aspartate carbamoyltransferase catalytic subunit
MHCDLLVVRHDQSGAPNLLAQKVDAAVINAGDGTHEHPTQALLDALTIRRRKGALDGLTVAICGDVLHSRVARSNIHLLTTMGSRVRVVGPPTLMPAEAERLGIEVFHDMERGLADADIVMMLRLQRERMQRGEARLCEAGCAGDASGADEPRRRDRQRGGGRSAAQPDPRAGRDGRGGPHGRAGYAVARPRTQ